MKIQPLPFASALLLMGLGVVTLFAPDEVAGLLSSSGQATSGVAVQILAGAGVALWGATGLCAVLAALYARLFFGAPPGGKS